MLSRSRSRFFVSRSWQSAQYRPTKECTGEIGLDDRFGPSMGCRSGWGLSLCARSGLAPKKTNATQLARTRQPLTGLCRTLVTGLFTTILVRIGVPGSGRRHHHCIKSRPRVNSCATWSKGTSQWVNAASILARMRFGNSPSLVLEGHRGNSPAFQRRVVRLKDHPVPEARKKIRFKSWIFCRPSGILELEIGTSQPTSPRCTREESNLRSLQIKER